MKKFPDVGVLGAPLSEQETDARRLEQRAKQIELG